MLIMKCLLDAVKEEATLAKITRKCGRKELQYLDFLLTSGVITKVGKYYILSNPHPPAVFRYIKLKAYGDYAILTSSVVPIDGEVDVNNLASVMLEGHTTKVVEERKDGEHVVMKLVKNTLISKVPKYTCVKLTVPAWKLIIEVNEGMVPYTSSIIDVIPAGINAITETTLKVYKWAPAFPKVYGFIKLY